MATSNLSLIINNSSLIEGLLQTIGSLESLMRDLCGEVAFLHDELTRLREKDPEHDLERNQLMKLVEAKDGDIRKLTEKITGLLGKVDSLTKALEDKSHQLTNRNRGQFGTKTKAKTARRVDDYV